MPVFSYQGFDSNGKRVGGYVDAENLAAARGRLRHEGIFPPQLTAGADRQQTGLSPEIRLRRGVRIQDMAVATRQLSTLIAAGIPLVESLTALIDQIDNVRLKTVVGEIREKVNQGASLADSLEVYPQIFSNLFINMVRAGESSGTLELVLNRLADFTESQMRLKNRIVSVMAYPAIMVVIGLGILFILFTYVIPKVTKLYEDLKQALPLPTEILIAVSKFMVNYWYLLIAGLFLLVWITRRYIRTVEGRYRFDRFKLNAPLFGDLVRKVAISRFANTLSTLLASGVPVLKALDIVKNVVDNRIIEETISAARTSISEGQTIADPLKRSGQFPPLVIHMIAIGEKTGALEGMLKKIAETYDNQIDTRVATMTSLLEPIMIAVMGAVVGFIVFAVMLPIFNLNTAFR
jgi:general secretion pathway protein F